MKNKNKSYHEVSHHTYFVYIKKKLSEIVLIIKQKANGSRNVQLLEHFVNTTSITANTFTGNLMILVK